MFKNYLKIGWRNLTKNKVFSGINIFGLAVGLTSFLLIALYIFDEATFDRFHKNADHIYRIVESKTSVAGKETKHAGAGYQVSERSKIDFSEVKNAVRLLTFSRTNVIAPENTKVFYEDFTTANEAFLDVFDFTLLRGDRRTALAAPHSVIVTKETAEKFFGTTDVLGKALKTDRDSIPFNITGVLDNVPLNSHLSFNLLFSESSVTNADFKTFVNSDWQSGAFTSYLLLDAKANASNTENKINRLVAANEKTGSTAKSHIVLQPLKDVHFYSGDIEENFGKKGNISTLYIFSVIAAFVLLIACINYMNLTTARFTNRSKEIAVRKVTGALRKNLIAQFLWEAFLLTGIALLAALVLTHFCLPFFNAFTEKQLTLGLQTDYRIWLGILLIVLVAGFLSGLYPALIQSGARPLLLLRSRADAGRSGLSIRRILVVFQFTLSIIMIVATIVVYRQMNYVNDKDMGFNREQLVVVDINSGKVRQGAELIKSQFAQLAQVQEVSASSRVPGEWKDLPKVNVRYENKTTAEGTEMYFIGTDASFLKTYGIGLAKGRQFTAGSMADSTAVLLNETAAKELGITEPSEQYIDIPLAQPFRARVVGIVKDFNFQSLHQPLAPMVLGFQNNPVQKIDYFTARINTNNASETLKQMDAILHRIDQNHLFEYHFLDKQWDLFYRQDQIRQTIFLMIALLTIVIACLGLFGLATYAAEQRIREIGIRKVLGASVGSIVAMLSKDFIRLVLLAAVIAFPVAWWAMNKWLEDFAYRIHISAWIMVVAGVTAVLIALLTVSFQAFKAAVANPVKSLRTE